MARTLSSTLTAVKDSNQAHTHLLLGVTAGAQPFFFADQTLRFVGNDYVPRLTFSDTINHTRSLQLDRAVVGVENASLFVSDLLETVTLEGATATLRRLYAEADEAVAIFDGRVASCRIERGKAEIVLTSGLDPTARKVPERFYSGQCTWWFKSAECGFTGTEFSVCNKTFADCTARAQTHRFNGFIHLTRILQQQVPPVPAPDPVDPSIDFGSEMDPYYEGLL